MKLTLIVKKIIILFFPASTVTSTISTPPSVGTNATSCIITPSSETSPNTITSTVHGGKIKYFA